MVTAASVAKVQSWWNLLWSISNFVWYLNTWTRWCVKWMTMALLKQNIWLYSSEVCNWCVFSFDSCIVMTYGDFIWHFLWVWQAGKYVRITMNVAMICQTIIEPPANGGDITRDNITCKIIYTADGKQLSGALPSGPVDSFMVQTGAATSRSEGRKRPCDQFDRCVFINSLSLEWTCEWTIEKHWSCLIVLKVFCPCSLMILSLVLAVKVFMHWRVWPWQCLSPLYLLSCQMMVIVDDSGLSYCMRFRS